ncbi:MULTISPECIES: hypothetical protein [Methylobacterium]|jgi:hypothetical protein|uniref:hypothetical protein n=1 Tax=Methylobacterium TaxID=407 RepID=UPI0009E65DFF|nr:MULTISPECIES: hypothetical protein [Methylobacterium]
MYLPVPPQPDCATAWREAVRAVDAEPGHEAYNVIIDVADPTAGSTIAHPGVAAVDAFLASCAKPIETVANTIFPAALYYRHGAPEFFDVFNHRVLAKVRRGERWSGYYFERMIDYPVSSGNSPNQLWNIVTRMGDRSVKALNKYEISLFDPVRDVDNSPYGGQCLSFLSFKIVPSAPRKLILTAQYRNHYYVEKLLGNIIGLGRLMSFVAREAELEVGSLTIVSTHAKVDQPPRTNRGEIKTLLAQFDQAIAPVAPATV